MQNQQDTGASDDRALVASLPEPKVSAHSGNAPSRGDRPSQHGAIFGRALAEMERIGRELTDGTLPETCLTCAFRAGCATNQSAGTGLVAFKCAIGIDDSQFGCHHGLKDGQPTKLCAGYYAAMRAPFEAVKAITERVHAELGALDARDLVREQYDAWLARTDPEGKIDVYQLARAYARDSEREQEK